MEIYREENTEIDTLDNSNRHCWTSCQLSAVLGSSQIIKQSHSCLYLSAYSVYSIIKRLQITSSPVCDYGNRNSVISADKIRLYLTHQSKVWDYFAFLIMGFLAVLHANVIP
jgi:hypothetical protein